MSSSSFPTAVAVSARPSAPRDQQHHRLRVLRVCHQIGQNGGWFHEFILQLESTLLQIDSTNFTLCCDGEPRSLPLEVEDTRLHIRTTRDSRRSDWLLRSPVGDNGQLVPSQWYAEPRCLNSPPATICLVRTHVWNCAPHIRFGMDKPFRRCYIQADDGVDNHPRIVSDTFLACYETTNSGQSSANLTDPNSLVVPPAHSMHSPTFDHFEPLADNMSLGSASGDRHGSTYDGSSGSSTPYLKANADAVQSFIDWCSDYMPMEYSRGVDSHVLTLSKVWRRRCSLA